MSHIKDARLIWGNKCTLYCHFRIPNSVELGTLNKTDAATLYTDWEGSCDREDLEGYFRFVIKNFDNSCLRGPDGELLAYVCMQFNGSMAILYVKPDQEIDYSRIVLTDLTRKLLRKGEVAYGYVPVNNSLLINMMIEMGFVWVPRGDMVWVHFEPLKINRGCESSVAKDTTYPGHCKQSMNDSENFKSRLFGTTNFMSCDSMFVNRKSLASEHATWVTS